MTAVIAKTKAQAWLGFGFTAALFIASGFSSLIYQVVWTRMLVLVFGSTTFATATVLAVFMGGLAAGSYAAGRVSDKIKRPFLWYGILEGVIGLWALLVPILFAAAVPLYRLVWQSFHPDLLTFSLVRFLMAATILILPTSCMGATLPLLSRFVTSSLDIVGKRVGTLYSVNTAGAVAGSILAGFLLLPLWGLAATTAAAALINFLLCGVVIWVAPNLEHERPQNAESQARVQTALPWLVRLAIFSFGVSGAVAMIYEVGWTRTLLMVIGSSTYAFTVMLSTFLVGIFLGSLICARFIDRMKEPVAFFAALEIALCILGMVSMFSFNLLPWWNLKLNVFFPHDPLTSLVARFLLASAILLPLTVCLGAIFPAIVKAATRDLEAVGKSVGTLYSVNTLGAIIGSFAAGFILIPALGVERTLIFASVANLVLGIGLFLCMKELAPIAKVVLVVFSLPVLYWCQMNGDVWDKAIMLTAQSERRHMVQSNLSYSSYDEWLKGVHKTAECLFWKDGASSTVGIMHWKDAGHRSLVTNGHVDASDGIDKQTQILLAAYPLLWKPDIKDVAVIGWGSGMTIGTVSLFPVTSITAVELEPSVVAASTYFHHINHKPDLNPRIHLEVNDGRNYLLATNHKFDAIISEPSNPWQAGVCNLFTKEYFQVCRERLAPGGVFSFWLQCVEIPPENLKEIFSALHSVFPYDLSLMTDRGNMVVLASDHRLSVDYAKLKAAFQNQDLKNDLGLIDMDSAEAVLARTVASPDGIDLMVKDVPPNVDDTNKLEWAVGRTYENRFFMQEDKEMVETYLGKPWDAINYGSEPLEVKAHSLAEIGRQALLLGRDINAVRWAKASLAMQRNVEAYRVAGIAFAQLGRRADAHKLWAQGLALDPRNVETLQTRGMDYLTGGEIDLARKDFLAVLAIEPDNHPAQFHMAQTYSRYVSQQIPYQKTPVFFPSQSQDQSPELVVKYLTPLIADQKLVANHSDIFFLLGEAELQLEHIADAEAHLRRFLTLEPDSISGQRVLGSILERQGKLAEAAGWWFSSFNLARTTGWNLFQKANESLKSGQQQEAIHLMVECLQIWPADTQVYNMLEFYAKNNPEAARTVKELEMLGLKDENRKGN